MPKVTLDMDTFKALASDTRLDILRTLDGKKLSLKDISKITNLNKATLHEHLAKLNEVGLVKRKEREGHKWVYYKLTWKGEGLLHPENTKIVVMFSITFISLLLGIMLLVSFAQPMAIGMAETYGDITYLYAAEEEGIPLLSRSYNYNYLGGIDAKEQTVDDLTTELQNRLDIKDSLGNSYDNDDIQWMTPQSNTHIEADQSIGFYASSDKEYNEYDKNNSINETDESNNTNGNMTMSEDRHEGAGMLSDFSPIIPEMIAMVQDPTLLYFAIACITFFGISFTASTWKLWKNKKPVI